MLKPTKLEKTKLIFWVSLFVSIACFIGGYAVSPEQVAIHFGADGSVNNTSSSFTLLLIWLAVTLFAVLPLYLIAISIKKFPEDSVNLPNKAFWFAEENKAEAFRRLEACLINFASATTLFLAAVSILVSLANQDSVPQLNMTFLSSVVGVFLGYLIVWTFQLFKMFKVPV
ncbi:DUF1648 domain-containing protein [Glaciecola siphonariae]|uniref:DUF1648 domain-containing protein n=1 Tax=Glaciecola siphonariae TaxID=521012 RepID=A0ABV9LWI7_9ALTE